MAVTGKIWSTKPPADASWRRAFGMERFDEGPNPRGGTGAALAAEAH